MINIKNIKAKNILKTLGILTLALGIMMPCSAFAKEASYKVDNKLVAKASNIENGKYVVNVKVLKEKSDDLSMAGQYVGQTMTIKSSDNKLTASINFSRLDWMKNIDILVNGSSVHYDLNKKNAEEGRASFNIPSINSNIVVRMNVIPMGNARVSFRIVPDKNLKKIESGEKSIQKSPKNKEEKVKTKTQGENIKNPSKNNENEIVNEYLPKTGFPISQLDIPLIGGVTALIGLGVTNIKNRKK